MSVIPEQGLSTIFEVAVVIVEVFTIYILHTGCYKPNSRPNWQRMAAYIAYGLVLGFCSVYHPIIPILLSVTIVGFLVISMFLYQGHLLHHIFIAILYVLLVIIVDVASAKISLSIYGNSTNLSAIQFMGPDRILLAIISKTMMLAIAKVISIIMERHKESFRQKIWRVALLLTCQLILVLIITSNFIYDFSTYNALTNRTLAQIIGVLFVSIIIVWQYDLLLSAAELKHKNEIISINLDNQIKYYHMVKANHDKIKAIEHDMRKHINTLSHLIDNRQINKASEYISSYADSIAGDSNIIFADHPIVNAMLYNCVQRAKEIDIEPTLDISIPQSLDVSDIDLTIILGNIIDNALEALGIMPAGNNKFLTIILKQHNYHLFFEVVNSFIPGKKHHKNIVELHGGYGLSNVEMCVNKYDGKFTQQVGSGVFTATVIISSRANSI